jgi:hypothetical protein
MRPACRGVFVEQQCPSDEHTADEHTADEHTADEHTARKFFWSRNSV